MKLCTPLITPGGSDVVYVMPNLQPPITKVSDALSYHEKLSHLAPDVTFLMSLFLHPDLNASIIAEAARTKIIYGVKLQCSYRLRDCLCHIRRLIDFSLRCQVLITLSGQILSSRSMFAYARSQTSICA